MTKNRFRAIVVGKIIFVLVAAVLVLKVDQQLPPELDAFVGKDLYEEYEAIDYIGMAVVFIAIAADIGLLFFARWARPIFLTCIMVLPIFTVFSGPFVATALQATVYEFSLMLDGFVIALAYFSGARVYFESAAT